MDDALDPAFPGPLFIVGSPRSGTKLLRDLLNRGRVLNLCNPETHFIPYLYRKHGGGAGGLHVDLDALYADFDDTPFQVFSRRMGHRVMSRGDFEALRDAASWAEAFEIILRFCGDPDAPVDAIWGDKTPSYVLEMPLLKEIFPAARFVHIIRDPRDVALSARRAWGHSPNRVAGKWLRDLTAARRDRDGLGADYLEAFYERLLADPEAELRRICDFAGCRFVPDMTTLAAPSENIGSAKGKRFVDRGNLGKWRSDLTAREQKRIEEIVFPAIDGLPYALDHARRHVPLSRVGASTLRAIDGSKSVWRYMRKKGLIDGVRISLGNRLQKRRQFRGM